MRGTEKTALEPQTQRRRLSLKLNQPRGQAGRFASMYAEKRGDAIALRLPLSLDQALRQVVGWQSKADNAVLKAWVEDAIAQKLLNDEKAAEFAHLINNQGIDQADH